MASETDDSAPRRTYELVCTDCEFEATVDGTVHDALDVADSHQQERGTRIEDHFVTFKLQGYTS